MRPFDFNAYIRNNPLIKEDINEAQKKITVTTSKGTEEYTDADIQDMIDNLDSYMSSDNLPKWMYLASFYHPNFPRTKKGILNMLNNILASNSDVNINVASNQPPYLMNPGVSKR